VSSRRARGFTLLEIMAVVLLLGLVFLVMGGVFSQIAATTTDAIPTETTRRGLLLVDRIARDLEGATLVKKPEELDPLAHPWLFLAESRLGRGGADRLKFDTRSARSTAEHAGDVSVVAYWLEPGDGDDLRLLRWSSPALPESLELDFPSRAEEGVQVVANGLTRFGVRLTDEDGAVFSAWNSSALERSGQLPIAAEITLALRDEVAQEGERAFTRRVVLPLRPLDLEQALSGEDAGDEDDEDEDGEEGGATTAAECAAQFRAQLDAALRGHPNRAAVEAELARRGGEPAAVVLADFGLSPGICP
jgi:prepilin-type N-terminal cleavage/methylation domain-containing protein